MAQLVEGMISDIRAAPLDVGQLSWIDDLPEAVKTIHNTIASSGGGIWLVGGAVREAMRGRQPKDHDLATSLTPDDVESLFEHTVPTGKQFGTITVIIDKVEYEVTTLRCESGYRDGRRPDKVQLTSSLDLDLERRDFTINAMAVDIARRELYDPHNGMSDLAAKRLRAVGSASLRLSEDGLRVMRAYRFLDQDDGNDWRTDMELELALIERQDMLEGVAEERIWQEMLRILGGRDVGRVLARMARDSVLDKILGGKTPEDDRRIRALRSVVGKKEASLCMAVLLKDRDGDAVKASLKRIKASNAFISSCIDYHSWLGTSPLDSDEGLIRLFRHSVGEKMKGFLNMDESWQKEIADVQPQAFTELRQRLRELPANKCSEPIADGLWLMQHTGLQQGKRVGRLKAWLHRIQLERDLDNLEQIEEVLCSIPWQHGDVEMWPTTDWP